MNLTRLFRPRSIAVVGASANPEKLGHTLLRNVLSYGYRGAVYPVNPSGGRMRGLRVYRSLEEVPRPLDLALVSVPNTAVPGVLAQADGAAFAVVLSSGFDEMGGGRALGAGAARLVGPNCMGVYSIRDGLNATYFWDLPRRAGGVGFVSQSGAYGGLLFSEARRRDIGIGTFVSIGNQADLTHADFVEHLARDPHTSVIALFVEQVRDGPRLLKAVAQRKPVVVFKVGRTAAGARAAASHTASMAGDAATFRAALTQAGAVVAETTDEFFDLVAAFAAYPKGRPRRRGVAICTISGGPCVAAADAAEAQGLPVPVLSPATRRAVRRLIPPFGADANPVDMTPQMKTGNFKRCVEAVLADRAIGGAVAINVGLDRPEFADGFTESGKPVVAFTVDVPAVSARLAAAGIPIFPTPERAVRAYRALAERPVARLPKTLVAGGPAGRRRLLPDPLGVLRRRGVPTCRGIRGETPAEAVRAAARLGYPVALKSLAAHKTDRGEVALDLKGPRDVARAARAIRPFVVQPMVPADLEIIVGARRDPTFGPVVMVAAGGVFAELIKDPVVRLCPSDGREMVSRLPLLGRFRGRAPAGPAVAAIVRAVSRLMVDRPEIEEVDVNPVRVYKGRAVAVDALIAVREAP